MSNVINLAKRIAEKNQIEEELPTKKLVILNQRTSQVVVINLEGDFPEDKTLIDGQYADYQEALDLVYLWGLNKEELIFFPQDKNQEVISAIEEKLEQRKAERSQQNNVIPINKGGISS